MTLATPIRILAATLALSLPWAALAADTEPAAEDAAPAITVVKGGGVAEVYREQGGDFAAFGPDGGAPERAEAVELRVLRALRAATELELVGLETAVGETANLSCGSACVGGYAVRGRAPVPADSQAAVRDLFAAWIDGRAANAPACAATYGHALKFAHDGYRYEVLLAADCGHYRILRGGVPVAEGRTESPAAVDGLDALLGGTASR